MKKNVFAIVLIIFNFAIVLAQTGKGIRIGYIDMEYILQNVPEYAQANNQLELKAQGWKQELDVKQNEITRLKEVLKTEKVLLTKELIEEREEAITFLEKEYSEFQQKKFGPTGDLMVQRQVLVKPIQDQVFTAVQELAEANKYDFILDKSSDLTLLFADKKWNLSERVIKKLTRSARISNMSKKQIKAEDAKDFQDDLEAANPDIKIKKKTQEDRILANQKKKDDAIAARVAKKEAEDARKAQAAALKLASKTTITAVKKDSIKINNADTKVKNLSKAIADKASLKKAADSLKTKNFEDRKNANEARKAKVLAEKDSIRKANQKKIVPKKE